MFKKVLCATDFSPGADVALQAAVQLVKQTGGELVLFHAWHMVLPLGLYNAPAEVGSIGLDNARVAIAKTEVLARQLGAPKVSSHVVPGSAWPQIVAAAEVDPTIDVIVVGTHGRTGLARVVMGSVAENVVRHATCSVFVVRPDYVAGPIHNILCPTEFSDVSRDAFDVATELAAAYHARLTVMHVVDGLDHVVEPTAMTLAQDIETRVDAELDRWRARALARAPELHVGRRARFGRPGAEILRVLEDSDFQLLVVGSHGRTGVPRLVLGSVAEKLVRHAPCPVLVVRPNIHAGEITSAA